MYAASRGHIDIVKILVNANVNIEDVNKDKVAKLISKKKNLLTFIQGIRFVQALELLKVKEKEFKILKVFVLPKKTEISILHLL